MNQMNEVSTLRQQCVIWDEGELGVILSVEVKGIVERSEQLLNELRNENKR